MKLKQRAILWKHRRALGDGLMFSAGIRDFKLLFPKIKINVDSNQSALWENNPYIDTSLTKGQKGVEYYQVGYPMIGNVNNTNMHFTSMFLFDMIASADLHKPLGLSIGEFCAIYANGTVGDPPLGNLEKNASAKEPFISLREKYKKMCQKFTRQRGDIHLTDKEKRYHLIGNVYGIDKYWVIAPGGKRDCTAKIWDWRQFQDVIDYFDGKLKFVVIGKSDLIVEKLNNVIDLTDKFNDDLRGLFSLVYNSDGCVAGPSFLMHLAAAMPSKINKERKPCVSIFGGREPTTWSWYCNQQILHTNGIFSCCDNGGCWKARTYPLPKDPKHNKNLCSNTVKIDDRTVQACMNTITSNDVIRAIEKYYEGDIYKYSKIIKKSKIKKVKKIKEFKEITVKNRKEINLLGNLNSTGGGEQSLCMIAKVLRNSGWKVNLYPWSSVNEKYSNVKVEKYSFKNGMLKNMKEGLPLFFYGNDSVWDLPKMGRGIVEKSSSLIVSINFMNGDIPKWSWLAKTKKLRGVIFQNPEKKEEWEKTALGFDETKLIVYVGAIDLNTMLEVCPLKKEKNDALVILKCGKSDPRKYVTKDTQSQGKKIHIWQKHFQKETDTKFYSRLLIDTKNTRFEFMEAPSELSDYFKNNSRMIFHKWDSMSVSKFLSRGHLYLERGSNAWRHSYPRTIGEALAVGLPVLCEPRDGGMARVGTHFGDLGLVCCDYDQYMEGIKKFQRKEGWRYAVGMHAKDFARSHLDPRKWVNIIEDLIGI